MLKSNEAFRLGVQDELDRYPVPVDLPLRGYEFYQQYDIGRRFVKALREEKGGLHK